MLAQLLFLGFSYIYLERIDPACSLHGFLKALSSNGRLCRLTIMSPCAIFTAILYMVVVWPLNGSILTLTMTLVPVNCLLWLPATGMAAEVTEAELTRLEQIFQQLAINNEALLSELTASKQDLSQARQRLGESQQALMLLQNQLLVLKIESAAARGELEQAQNSLQSANKSLQAYEREMQRERSRLKLQRDIGFVLLIFSFVRQS